MLRVVRLRGFRVWGLGCYSGLAAPGLRCGVYLSKVTVKRNQLPLGGRGGIQGLGLTIWFRGLEGGAWGLKLEVRVYGLGVSVEVARQAAR